MELSQIKLLIWDLDETLWNGTLSEGDVSLPDENKQLIIDAVNAGVMCSICSKNDSDQVHKQLCKEGLDELFVFTSVNWSPKGVRVKEIINEMNLRQCNVMFIDDNASNRGEVKSCCPEITVEDVDIISELISFFADRNNTDLQHERLNRYKLLEKKRDFQAQVGSNLEFLRQSNITVQVHTNCMEHVNRIYELLIRTNQLNFTKIRSSKEELVRIIEDDNVECAYITVSDNFGDYGIVGFYAKRNDILIHFAFSCRILGMGVEQYIYKSLGNPKLNIVGEVASNLTSMEVNWINQDKKVLKKEKLTFESQKILLKGPCDLEQMFAYISDTPNIITEFVYVNDNGIRISQGTHTMHIVQSRQISESNKIRLADELIFGDIGMYQTKMFDSDIDYIVLSLFADPSFGLYRERKTGIVVAYGEYVNDLTDVSKWDKYINGEVFLSNCRFKQEDLEKFAENYEFIGRMTPEDIVNNLDEIYKNINTTSVLILVLGSETDYLNNTKEAYVDRHKYHKQLNCAVREWQRGKERVRLIDVNKFITGQSDFTNNINHFNRSIYYKMSNELISIIESCGGYALKKNNRFIIYLSKKIRFLNQIFNKMFGLFKRNT